MHGGGEAGAAPAFVAEGYVRPEKHGQQDSHCGCADGRQDDSGRMLLGAEHKPVWALHGSFRVVSWVTLMHARSQTAVEIWSRVLLALGWWTVYDSCCYSRGRS